MTEKPVGKQRADSEGWEGTGVVTTQKVIKGEKKCE